MPHRRYGGSPARAQKVVMGDKLVIVESPSKAKTIQKYLGRGYRVTSSMGHVRDLPKRDLAIDIEHDFAPSYEVTKQKVVSDLRQAARAEFDASRGPNYQYRSLLGERKPPLDFRK